MTLSQTIGGSGSGSSVLRQSDAVSNDTVITNVTMRADAILLSDNLKYADLEVVEIQT